MKKTPHENGTNESNLNYCDPTGAVFSDCRFFDCVLLKLQRCPPTGFAAAWKEAFERIKAPLWERLQTWLSAVEHVGSTSVEGLWAKPIIDLDLVLKEPGFFPQVKQELALLGYFHEGDLGIPQREAFAYQDKPDLMAHHLYVCPPDSLELLSLIHI